MEKEFYVLLPSNTKSDEFPNNTISNFSIGLPKQLELGSDSWETSLVSISYPHTWYNIDRSFAYINIKETIVSTLVNNDPIINKQKLPFSPGYYNSGKEIVEKLNTTLKDHSYRSKFTYDDQSNKVSVLISLKPDKEESIVLPKDLASILGFHTRYLNTSYPIFPVINPNDPEEGTFDKIDATSCVDLNIKTHNLFIYTNIVKDTLVGNYFVPLLRTVPTREKNRNTYVSVSFTNPYYLPLVSNYIKQITIDIKDDQGENIKFQSGKVTAKLHFRIRE